MSSDNNLQEMEAGTTQSKTAVNAGAKPADPMPTMADPGTQFRFCRRSWRSYTPKLQDSTTILQS